MRIAVACTLALLLAPSLASSTDAEPQDALIVSIYTAEDLGALVTWSPAPNAIGYAIYRGPTLESAEYVGQVAGLAYHDEDPLEGDSWYTVVSIGPSGTGPLGGTSDWGRYKGSCVSQRGTTGITITAAHCMPADPL